MRLILTIGAWSAVFLASVPAMAQERLITEETLDGGFYVGTGVTKLQANEIVWAGNHRLSHLIWQSTAPVLRAGFDVNFADGWTFKANGSAAMGGDSHMEDYDWTDWDGAGGPATWSDNWDEWTDRSEHPDTRLDYYVALDAAIGYDVIHTAEFTANVNVGLKYTDVKWSAYGGSALYSWFNGYRNTTVIFADGLPVIDFNQKWPVAFAGLDTEFRSGALTLGADAKAGVTFSAGDVDNHFLRDLLIMDYLRPSAVLMLSVDASYAVSENSDLFLALEYEKIFEARGDKQRYIASTGAPELTLPDFAGGDFQSFSLTGGFKGQF
jgi:plasminogen activator